MVRIDISKRPSPSAQKSESKNPAEMERTRERPMFLPRTDIYEKEDALILFADMPGVDEKSVEINIDHRVLTIIGRVAPDKMENHSLTYAEYETGDFERSFSLSDEVDVDKIVAVVKQGVLQLTLPKAQSAKPRKITVKAG